MDAATSKKLSNIAAEFVSTMRSALVRQAQIIFAYVVAFYSYMSKHEHSEEIAGGFRDKIVTDFDGKEYLGTLVLSLYRAARVGGRLSKCGLVKATKSTLVVPEQTTQIAIQALYAVVSIFSAKHLEKISDKKVLSVYRYACEHSDNKDVRKHVNEALGIKKNASAKPDAFARTASTIEKFDSVNKSQFDMLMNAIAKACGIKTVKKYVGSWMNDN